MKLSVNERRLIANPKIAQMSIYNIINTKMPCPRCGEKSEMEVNRCFGCRNLIEYKIGDKVEWVPLRVVQNGEPPENGNPSRFSSLLQDS